MEKEKKKILDWLEEYGIVFNSVEAEDGLTLVYLKSVYEAYKNNPEELIAQVK